MAYLPQYCSSSPYGRVEGTDAAVVPFLHIDALVSEDKVHILPLTAIWP